MSDVENIKRQVLAAAKDMLRKGLTEGTAGNISARLPDGNIVITPSSVDYEAMTLDDLCVIDLATNVLEGTRGPSSEKLLHLACYKGFDDIKSVIHAHPIYATMFAVAHEPIPACIDEFSIFVGGDVAADLLQHRFGRRLAQRRVVRAGADLDDAARHHLAAA